MAEGAEVVEVEGGLKFTWSYDETADWERQEDQVMLMAYLPNKGTAVFIYSGARRNAREATLAINSSFLGEEVETYIAFISDDRTRISKSVYTGKKVYGSLDSSLQGSLPPLLPGVFSTSSQGVVPSSLRGGTLKQSTPYAKPGTGIASGTTQPRNDGLTRNEDNKTHDDGALNASGNSSSAAPS